jgi:hypothetical protein
MISYHPEMVDAARPSLYAAGFRVADTNKVERLKSGIKDFVWSPIIWRSGHRRQVNFLRADWCVLDFDDGEMSLNEAVKAFCDCIHIIGTTKSHQRGKGGLICDRFRVALKWDAPLLDLHLYRWNMHKLIDRYPVDKSCMDGARYFFPCREIISAADEGYTQEIDEDVPSRFESPVDYGAYRDARIMPPWTRANLERVIPTGERNITCYQISKDLLALGLPADKVLSLIIQSPTYNGIVSETVRKEIQDVIKSARNKLADEQDLLR